MRLIHESPWYLVATLRQQIDHSDDTQPHKVAFAERIQRMDRLRQDLGPRPLYLWRVGAITQFVGQMLRNF